ncbi:MAG TPA: bifunctional riboflavin kinase/FAD synthetase [Prosthecobacter sp.]
MQVLRSIDALSTLPGPLALAVGVFDGLHLGHQEVIRAAQEHATQHHGTAVVATFDPHPAQVLRPGAAPKLLCGQRHQQVALSQIGISHLLACPFTPATALTPARDFILQLIRSSRPLGCISVGYTWQFGHHREGDIHLLMDLGQQHGFAVYGVPAVKVDDEVVSSTLIREAITQGKLDRAARFLGREYSVFGTVIEGRRLGRQLGFPTANVDVENEQLPPLGVYAVQARIGEAWLPAVANLGRRPSVEAHAEPLLEVHFPNWSGDLYGQDLEVRFTRFLRPEMKFGGLDELKTQIQRDVEAAMG